VTRGVAASSPHQLSRLSVGFIIPGSNSYNYSLAGLAGLPEATKTLRQLNRTFFQSRGGTFKLGGVRVTESGQSVVRVSRPLPLPP
jgi:hypothetical protein